MAKLLVINGPNLNLLGEREPGIYGSVGLEEIEQLCADRAAALGHEVVCFQSNAEGALIERVQQAKRDGADFVIINPGGYTHTSVALRDAFLGTAMPFIEVHISNVHARESFRRESYLSDVAVGVITGLGPKGYALAVEAAADYLARA